MWTIAVFAGCSVLAALLAAIVTHWLTRRREQEAEWRKLRFSQYKELMFALSGIVEGRSTDESQARYSDAFNCMALVASSHVLKCLQAFQNEISSRNQKRDGDKHDYLFNELMRAMRADLSQNILQESEIPNLNLINAPITRRRQE